MVINYLLWLFAIGETIAIVLILGSPLLILLYLYKYKKKKDRRNY